jgi:hypothetical protein
MIFSVEYSDYECCNQILLEGPEGITPDSFLSLCEFLKPDAIKNSLLKSGGYIVDMSDVSEEFTKLLELRGYKRINPVSFELPVGGSLEPSLSGYSNSKKQWEWLGDELAKQVEEFNNTHSVCLRKHPEHDVPCCLVLPHDTHSDETGEYTWGDP